MAAGSFFASPATIHGSSRTLPSNSYAATLMAKIMYRHVTLAFHPKALTVTVAESQLRDAPTCYALRDEIVRAIDAAQLANLVLDLRLVKFIGSIGFLAFLGARRHLETGRIILCGMDENVRDLFRLCALISYDRSQDAPFEVSDSVESALALLSA